MKTNIFENAKFGDRFYTKEGMLLIFCAANRFNAILICQPQDCIYQEKTYELDGHYYKGGETKYDIKL